MEIIVGRTALNACLFKQSKTDTDVWTNEQESYDFWKKAKADVCLMPKHIMDAFSEETKKRGWAVLPDLLAIKLSHLPYDIFWWKHIQDVLLLRKMGVEPNNTLKERLSEHWKEEFGGDKPFLSLYRQKDQFFNDFVPKKYEHDYLHTLVAEDGVPVYTEVLQDGQEVMVDKEKFFSLPLSKQIRMFKEEVAVIALERWVIPSLTNPLLPDIFILCVWQKALHKTVTALTKGWASDLILSHIEEFLIPLESEMLYALDKLNLKEKYMLNTISLEKFQNLIIKRVIPDYDNRYFKNLPSNPTDGDIQAAREEYVTDDFTEGLLCGFPLAEGVEFIEQKGGHEGGSEYCYSVFKIDGTYYKVEYSYYSHNGFETDYAEVSIVYPKEKTITVYE